MNVRQVIPRDAIPSVDDPSFGDEYDGDPSDRVVVVDAADPPRAYPVRYLNYHEIVNDVLDDGRPVAVTWCPLCGSGVVYDRVVDGRALEFGVSGKLADDDLVLYDRETGSEYKQSSGECIGGEFAGETLTVLPGAMISWRDFQDSYPDGIVLQAPGGESETASEDDEPAPIEYEDAPYEDYVSGEGFGLDARRGEGSREWARDDIDAKTVVLGVERDGEAVGFPLPWVQTAGGVVQTTVGGQAVVVVATEDGIHAFEDPGHDFGAVDGSLRADGATWDPATGESSDGRELARVPARRLFAFAWQDDHGEDAFYRRA
jgi:hypothetical protein